MHATAPAATANPIDALAVARAALREPDLPTARLGPAREVRLLVSHREDLVAERTRIINRLRWHLHELNPSWQPPARSLWRPKHLATTTARLHGIDGLVARLARALIQRCRMLSDEISELDRELEPLVRRLAPALLELRGRATPSTAKILGEPADIERFHSRHAYARHNPTAPVPVGSGNRTRHRLSRIGNRRLNTALRRIAITQARYHPAGAGVPRTSTGRR